MKKSKILSILLLVACTLTFTAGCTNSSSNVSSEPSRTPSMKEISNALKSNENWSYLGSVLKKMVKDMFKLTIGGEFETEFGGSISGVLEDYASDNLESNAVLQKINETFSFDVTGVHTYTNVAQMARLSTSVVMADDASINEEQNYPITILKGATITHANGTKEKVNLVALTGLMTSQTEATSMATAIYIGFQLQNEFIYDVYYAIYNTLKGDEETPLFITGMSLGGMAAQQVAGLENLTKYFDVKYVVAIGSPLIAPETIDYSTTVVRRMVDTDDVVPQLASTFNGSYESKYKNNTVIVRNHPSYNTFIGSHIFGYNDEDFWGDVDVLGVENGGATITVDWDTVSWHDAPETESKFRTEVEKVQQ